MKPNQTMISIARIWFDYWLNHPDAENYIFNESKSIIATCAWVCDYLVNKKYLLPLVELSEEHKTSLKQEAYRIDPTGDVKKRMDIAKTIYVFSYLSNN